MCPILSSFTFPVDTSMNVEIVENRKALTTVRNKKKELKDLDNHAYQAGSETSSNVVDALDSVDELETDLDQSKESMYKLSYDKYGNVCIVVDMELKGRIREALIKMILDFDIPLETEE